MKHSKESLTKLLLFLGEISKNKENEWFKEELTKLIQPQDEPAKSDLSFESFVRLQRRNFKIKANEFYKSIADCRLKKDLVRDHQEMLWFRMMNHIDRYYLFIYYQMENMLNHFLLNKDAFTKVKSCPDAYHVKFSERFIVKCYSYFFDKNGNPNEVVKINSIYAKIAFWALESNNDAWIINSSNKQTLDNIVNVRNLLSHKNSAEQGTFITNQIEYWKKGDDSNLSYPISFLNKIKKTV